MRPRLLFILLFSILCGYNISASQAATGSHAFHHSGIEQLSSWGITCDLSIFRSIYPGTTAEFLTAADMEDEEDPDCQSSRKSRLITSSIPASSQVIILSRHSHSLPATPASGILSCKYITQRTLRI